MKTSNNSDQKHLIRYFNKQLKMKPRELSLYISVFFHTQTGDL